MEMSPGVSMTAALNGLTVTLSHEPSGASMSTVPPKDNGGDGSSFSPTDLLAASLAACVLATLALQSKREGLPFGSASARITKHMSGPPRRVERLVLVLEMPKEARPSDRQRLEEIAKGCPVARSLHPELLVDYQFNYT
jgi:putative redox protein